MAARSVLLEATPPAIANLEVPYSFTARIAFSTNTSVTAFWKDAAISARL